MDRVGILVVSKCLSASAIIDTFLRSEKYLPEFYVIERLANPFNRSRAAEHAVSPALDLGEVAKFAKKFKSRIDFGLTDTEDFVVGGGRDLVERDSGVQMVCVTRDFAVEGSKAGQRELFERIFPGANPGYKVFDPKDYRSDDDALRDFRRFASTNRGIVVKPAAPARGAGVGVGGQDFRSEKEASAFFLNALSRGKVVVEEKVEGEESSFHAFSDGKHFVPAPMTRDYKRGMDGDRGKLTGGMGSYRGPGPRLPFVSQADWEELAAAEERAFRRWKGRGSQPGLRGVVVYDAIMHTGGGFKVLERNSRGGNTESVNLYTTMADDLADVCYRMLDGTLRGIRFKREASVATCAVPQGYGVDGEEAAASPVVGLASAYRLAQESRGAVRIFPMDVKDEGGATLMGGSRTVAVVGLGSTVEEARGRSLEGVRSLTGHLRWRSDIASAESIRRSSAHLRSLRSANA